jgi:Uma2 family endonuclease
MSRVAKPKLGNLGELLAQLGGVSASRVRFDPPPGKATKRDLIRLHARNDKLYELVDRTLVEKPMGSPESFLAAELIRIFGRFLDGNDLGFLYAPDALVEMLPDLVRGPDVCFVSWEKRPERTVPTEPISDLIPDLAVEVLSPSNTSGEIRRKLREYFLAGVRLVWVIEPRSRTAAVYTAPGARTLVPVNGILNGADVLPEFQLPLAKLFERLALPRAKKPRKRK